MISAGADPAEEQVVVAVGPHAEWNIGDIVKVNKFTFRTSSIPGPQNTGNKLVIHWPIEEIDEEKYLYLTDRQIKYARV